MRKRRRRRRMWCPARLREGGRGPQPEKRMRGGGEGRRGEYRPACRRPASDETVGLSSATPPPRRLWARSADRRRPCVPRKIEGGGSRVGRRKAPRTSPSERDGMALREASARRPGPVAQAPHPCCLPPLAVAIGQALGSKPRVRRGADREERGPVSGGEGTRLCWPSSGGTGTGSDLESTRNAGQR